jgi:hypothetical protein
MHARLRFLLEEALQFGQRDVVLLAHLTPQLLPQRVGEASGLTAAVRQRGEVAGRAPLPEHLLDEAGADAELLGDLGNRAAPLLVGADDPLA